MRPTDKGLNRDTAKARSAPRWWFKRKRIARWLVALVGFVGLPLWCALAIVVDRMGIRARPAGTYDAIVVAGCRVLPNGQPSTSLERRVTKAVEFWREGLAPRIALTGGNGKWQPSEAEASASLARRLGVPDSALVLENHSTSTIENARFLRGVSDFQRIVIVTDSYHVRRCEWFFGKYFQEVRGYGVISPFWDRAKGAFREVVAFAVYVATERWSLRDQAIQ